jgi:hypothetical protein
MDQRRQWRRYWRHDEGFIPLNKPITPPDLREWGRAAGSYQLIDWTAWDRACSEYERARRDQLLQEQSNAAPAGRRQVVGG